jgi:hypothetical protein
VDSEEKTGWKVPADYEISERTADVIAELVAEIHQCAFEMGVSPVELVHALREAICF